MGCELCKIDPQAQDPYHAPPPVDPRSPLNAKQRHCMLASWKGIFRAIEKTGIILFIKLFQDNEDLKHLFEKFRGLHSWEEQATSQELAEHANKVMHTLDESIKNLRDVDALIAMLHHVGVTHRRIAGFRSQYFWRIEKPFLEAAKSTLGERYTSNVQEIYTLTIRFILENLVKGYEEAPEVKC